MKPRLLFRSTLIALIMALMPPQTMSAGDPGLPASLRLTLFCKAMTFDRNLETRCGSEIAMGLLYQSRYQASVAAKDEIKEAFKASNITHVKKTPIQIVPIDLDASDWQERLVDNNIDILYLMPTRAFDVNSVILFSQQHKLLTMSSDPENVAYGISVGLRLANNRPKFVINLRSCKSEGVDFSSQLLGLAEVLE